MALGAPAGNSKNLLFIVLLQHFSRRMAGITGVLDVGRRMAGQALNHPFAAVIEGKGVSAKQCRRPGCRCMARFAVCAEDPGMDRRLGVTCAAFEGCAGELEIQVAGGALNFSVAAIQQEYILMIESGHPVDTVMTGHACRSELILMLCHKRRLFSLMAGQAGLFGKLLQAGRVAVGTRDRVPPEVKCMPVQIKTGIFRVVERQAIQAGRRPTRGRVACCTISPKHTQVHRRLAVAAGTFAGGLVEGSILMAAGARQRGMLPIQWKAGCMVGKTNHAIDAIMAIQALDAEIQFMLDDKGLILTAVAICADGYVCRKLSTGMAIDAGQGRRIVVNLVANQTKSCNFMVKVLRRRQNRVEVSAPMIRMAIKAASHIRDAGVEAVVIDFLPDIEMALHA